MKLICFIGGEFNRTAVIKYQSGETAYIRQQYYGHDALDNIRLSTQIEGTVPDIINGVKITLDDYKEEYRRISPGKRTSMVIQTYLFHSKHLKIHFTFTHQSLSKVLKTIQLQHAILISENFPKYMYF